MSIEVKRPARTVELVTDLVALQESISKANELNEAVAKSNGGLTEAEASTHRRSIEAKRSELRKLIAKVDESTLLFELHGLNSSKWNMIVVRNQSVKDDLIVKDWPSMVADALPDMIDSVKWKKTGEPVEFKDGELAELLESLSDTQTHDLMIALQELNSPVVSVPKAVTDLI